MIRELVLDEDKLSVRAKEVDIKDHELFDMVVSDLKDTILSLDDSVLYLTANQIGIDARAFAMKFRDGDVKVFINPAIQKKDKMILFRERDYLTKEEYFVPRFTELSIVYQEKDNKKLDYGVVKGIKVNEGASIVVGQALDSLNGLFDHDYGLIVLPEFDEAPDEEKSEVLEAYVSQLKDTYKELDKELSSDDETKKKWGASKFVTALARGDIEELPEELSNRKKRKLKRLMKQLGVKLKKHE